MMSLGLFIKVMVDYKCKAEFTLQTGTTELERLGHLPDIKRRINNHSKLNYGKCRMQHVFRI